MNQTKRIKLMIFIDSYRIGGMHKQVLYLVKHIDRARFEPIMCTSTSMGALLDDYKAIDCKMYDLAWKGRFDVAVITNLRRILKQEEPDLIFITEAQNLVYYRLAKVFLRSKTIQIGSFRGLTFWLGHEKIIFQYLDIILARLLYSTSKFVVVNSVELKEYYSKVISVKRHNPIRIIFNGCAFNFSITKNRLDVEKELKLNADNFLIIMVARLDPWKDFHTLLEAAQIVTTNNVRARFILLGNGIMRSEIEAMINDRHLEEKVFLVGEKKDVFNYINASDVSVLSTHGEGFSNSLMESMGLEKPVIATNVGGNLSVIGHTGEFGFLVPPKSPVALAEKIELLMNNDEERKSLGKRGKERIYSICSIEKYIASYEDLFETALRADR